MKSWESFIMCAAIFTGSWFGWRLANWLRKNWKHWPILEELLLGIVFGLVAAFLFFLITA